MITRILNLIRKLVKFIKYQTDDFEKRFDRIDSLLIDHNDQLATRKKFSRVLLKFLMKHTRDKNERLAILEKDIDEYRGYCESMWNNINGFSNELSELDHRLDMVEEELDKQALAAEPAIKAFLYGTPPKV